MAFPDEVADDVEATHVDWARDDITRRSRTVTAVSLTGSTPSYTEDDDTITGVLTVGKAALERTMFGGMGKGDATLAVLPAVGLDYDDLIICDSVTYRVEEVRDEDVQGTVVQRYGRLVRIAP